MKLTPMRTLAAGALLILLANGVALTGVYFNRSGEPEARMVLSQRELSTPWGWVGVVPLLTGLFGTCPLYTLLGIRTCPRR